MKHGLTPDSCADIRAQIDELPRAKPDERYGGYSRVEDMVGLFADIIDDEFEQSLRDLRRGRRCPKCSP